MILTISYYNPFFILLRLVNHITGSFHTFFHAISSDVIRKFHTLFPHILWKFRTHSPTYSASYGIRKSVVVIILSHNNDRLERYYE